MQLNPLFKRESQVRWRSWKPFALLFIYAMTLACLLGWTYLNEAASADLMGAVPLAEGGRQIFRAMQLVQMTAWLLVVPILASPLIAAERERGLLEALQLSGLTPWRIVGGKLCALIAFVLLVMLASAPVLGVCFMLGGVAPDEFMQSLALQAATIALCAAAGLYFSARARRTLAALRNVLIVVGCLGIGSAFAFDLWQWFVTGYLDLAPADVPDWTYVVSGGLTILNPVRAQLSVFDGFDDYSFGATPAAAWADVHPLRFAVAVWSLLLLLLLCGAARGVTRSFESGQFIERKRYLTFRRGRLRWQAATPESESYAAPKERTPRAVLETPLAQLVHFQNPVLQREVKGKLRLRRYPKRTSWLMMALAVVGLIAYVFCLLWTMGDPNSRGMIWGCLCGVTLVLLTLAMTLMGAGALTRERENGTWEMLHLSLLEPRQIIFGKVLAPLVMAGGLFACVLPLGLLPCIRWLAFSSDGSASAFADNGPPCDYALLTLLLLAASAFAFSAWGLWLSWRCSNTPMAMALAIVSLLVVLIVVPVLLLSTINGQPGNLDGRIDFLAMWHPYFALGMFFDPARSDYNNLNDSATHYLAYTQWHALRTIAVLLGVGLILLLDLNRRMERARRSPEV